MRLPRLGGGSSMLIGKLISLGPVIPADFPTLFRWGNDVDLARLNEVYRPSDWNSHQEWWSNIGKDPSRVVFAIRKQGSNNIIGYVQILNISGLHQSAHLAVRIGEAADRGHGYGKEATRLAIDYCWNHLNLGRIGLTVFKTHERALRVYSSLGFETEGVLRRAFFIDGQWVDAVLMSMLHPSRVNRQQPDAYADRAPDTAPQTSRAEELARLRSTERATQVAELPRRTRPSAYPRSPDGPGEPPSERGVEPRPGMVDRPGEASRQNHPRPYQHSADGSGEPPRAPDDESLRSRASERPSAVQEAPRRDRGRPFRENPASPSAPPGRTRPW
jgi:RimJ/RimL family protein N-acetyltransferase